jgi:hypothetical protein
MRARSRDAKPRPLILWRLRGDVEDLACAAIENSFGHALALTLAGELILLDLQPSIDHLVATADRLERWLLSRGWTHADRTPHTTAEE